MEVYNYLYLYFFNILNFKGVVHIYVDKASPQGNVYVKCPTVAIAYKSVVALHGRWFAGKLYIYLLYMNVII